MQKINQILQKVPRGGLYFASWMEKQGVSYDLQRIYRKSEWLSAIASGVMKRTNEKISVNGALYSFNEQLGKNFHIAGMSALELSGFSHFVQMGRPNLFISSPSEKLPTWMKEYDWGVNIIEIKSSYFATDLGIETTIQGDYELLVSSVERAFLECLNLVPKYFSLLDLFYVMEQLTALRPQLVQQFLEEIQSVKIKRLFLYMAEKSNHLWFGDINLGNIDLGKGKRMLSSNAKGVYVKKYQIVVPRELAEYE